MLVRNSKTESNRSICYEEHFLISQLYVHMYTVISLYYKPPGGFFTQASLGRLNRAGNLLERVGEGHISNKYKKADSLLFMN